MSASYTSAIFYSRNKNNFYYVFFHMCVLTLLFIAETSDAAPLSDDELLEATRHSQLSEYYGGASDSTNCYYNFQHYNEGDRIITNEPCLNCTCHKRMLMCYLRVCPFTKAVGQDCTVEKRPDQCCPVISCPEVPVQLLTSSTTPETPSTSSALAHPDTFGCMLENAFYPDGAQVPSDPKNPCELCYCIRNRTACILQECTLNVDGCRPVHQPGVCCPVRYDCDYEEAQTSSEPTVGSGLLLTTTQSPQQCGYHGQYYNDGEVISLMQSEGKSCERCYCMRGEIVCAVQECGNPLEGKDCEPLPPPPGQCCPTTYLCANETIPLESLSHISTAESLEADSFSTEAPFEQSTKESTENNLPLPSKQTPENDTPEKPTLNEETDQVKPEEQETADSKQSGTQIVPESEVVTSIAETHTKISVSTKQGEEGVTSPPDITKNEDVKTDKPEDNSQNQVSETTQISMTSDNENSNEKLEENEKDVTDQYPTKLPDEPEETLKPDIPVPHPIEIDEPETTMEEHTTKLNPTETSESSPIDSDPHIHHDPSFEEEGEDPIEEEKPHSTEIPLKPVSESEPIDKNVHTTSKPEIEQTTIIEKFSNINHDESESIGSNDNLSVIEEAPVTEESIPISKSPIPEDNDTGSSLHSETSTDRKDLDLLPTTANLVTEHPEEPSEVTTSHSVETEAPIEDSSKDEITTDAPSISDKDEEKLATNPEVGTTENILINNEEKKPEELKPLVISPLIPHQPDIEHDSPESLEEDSQPILTEKSPIETEKLEHETETPEQPVVEQEHQTTLPEMDNDSEKTTDSTDTENNENEELPKHEITTVINKIESDTDEEKFGMHSESTNEDAETFSPHKEQSVATTESIVSNEIASDNGHQVVHDNVKQPDGPEENVVDEKGVIPGEGSCLVDGVTYPDGSKVPGKNPCQFDCLCRSSIVECYTTGGVNCPPPPPNMKNCIPIQHNEDTCCPIYACDDEKEHGLLESHNQLGTVDESIIKNEEEKEKVSLKPNDETTVNPVISEITEQILTVSPVDEHKLASSELPSTIPEKEQDPEVVQPTTTEKPVEEEQTEDKNKKPDEIKIKPGVVSPPIIPDSIEHDHIPSHHGHHEENEEPEIPATEVSTETVTLKPHSAVNEDHVSDDIVKDYDTTTIISVDVSTEHEEVPEQTELPHEGHDLVHELVMTDSPANSHNENVSEDNPEEHNTQLPPESENVGHSDGQFILEDNEQKPEEDSATEEPVVITTQKIEDYETSSSYTPSKFEEFDLPESTIPPKESTIPPKEQSEDEHSTNPPSVQQFSPADVTTDDQSSVASENIDQHPTESTPEETDEEKHIPPTTALPDSEPQDQNKLETLHPIGVTENPLKDDELTNPNDILGSVLSAAGDSEEIQHDPKPHHEETHIETEIPQHEDITLRPVDEQKIVEELTSVSDWNEHTTVKNEIEHSPISTDMSLVQETTKPDESVDEHKKDEIVTERISDSVSTEHLTEEESVVSTELPMVVHHDYHEDIATTLSDKDQPSETVHVNDPELPTTESNRNEIVPEIVSEGPQTTVHPIDEEQPSNEQTTEPIQSPVHIAIDLTTEQLPEVKPEEVSEHSVYEESNEPTSEKTESEISESTDDEKKHETIEETKPPALNESSDSEEASHQSSEETIRPEDSEIYTTSTSSTQNPIELTTKYNPPIISTESQGSDQELPFETFSHMPLPEWTPKPLRPDFTTEAPMVPHIPEEEHQPFHPSGGDVEYEEEEENSFGPGTCRYGGKVFVSAQQVPRDNPCDFCFCFRSDIICLQQSCPPPIHGCRQESIQGFCCPRYECPVSMATALNLTTTTTTTTTTLPPHFFAHAYRGAARKTGCQVQGQAYRVGEEITSASGPCLHCTCDANGQMKCDPKVCSPEPMLRKMIEAAVRRRR